MQHTQPETILDFLRRNGIGDKASLRDWFYNDLVLINNRPVKTDTVIEGDTDLEIRGKKYRIKPSGEPGRLTLSSEDRSDSTTIGGKIRVQCGYHKCLTVYFKRVSRKTAYWTNPFACGFRHFFHRLDEFYADCQQHTLSSISGHCLDLDRFRDIRAVHIIRDPRDLIVSGYFYHKRAAEDWCEYINPGNEDWEIVNGVVPASLPAEMNLTQFLNQVSLEEGLAAEIEFRKNHLQSMLQWPADDPRVLTIRYEDVLGNEVAVFRKIYDFYGFPTRTKLAATLFADRYSAKSKHRKSSHIRNSSFGQWKELFTPELTKLFEDSYGELLGKYGY